MRRALRLIALGRIVEKAMLSDEPFYFKRSPNVNERGLYLRVDGEWALTPRQARTLRQAKADAFRRAGLLNQKGQQS